MIGSEVVVDPDSIRAFQNLNVSDVVASFEEFRDLLHHSLSYSSFTTLGKKIRELQTLLDEKEQAIKAAQAAAEALNFQLFDIEKKFYENPNDLKIIDEGYKPKPAAESPASLPASNSPVSQNGDDADSQLQSDLSSESWKRALSRAIEEGISIKAALEQETISNMSSPSVASTSLSYNASHSQKPEHTPQNQTTDLYGSNDQAYSDYYEYQQRYFAQHGHYDTNYGQSTNSLKDPESANVSAVSDANTQLENLRINAPTAPKAWKSDTVSSRNSDANSSSPEPRYADMSNGTIQLQETTVHGSDHHIDDPSSNNRFIVVRLTSAIPQNLSFRRLNSMLNKLNGERKIFNTIHLTRKGNIRITILNGFTYRDAYETVKVNFPGLEFIDSSDWLFLTAHGVPRTDSNGNPYTPQRLQALADKTGIRLARLPEWIDRHGSKGIVKLSFDSRQNRDDTYFKRALYLDDERAKFRFYPYEWYGNQFSKAHEEKFKHSQKHGFSTPFRFFQANCSFDLQNSHDVLFEGLYQARYLLIQDPWNFNDGRPCDRSEWRQFHENNFYEQGGTRLVLYKSKKQDSPKVFQPSTNMTHISIYHIDSIQLIHVDRPSDMDANVFCDDLENTIKEQLSENYIYPLIISGCFNIQHTKWDGVKSPPSPEGKRLAALLDKYEFQTMSPMPSSHIDENEYYTNPTLLFAQKSIAHRITIPKNNGVQLSERLTRGLKEYHRLTWDLACTTFAVSE